MVGEVELEECRVWRWIGCCVGCARSVVDRYAEEIVLCLVEGVEAGGEAVGAERRDASAWPPA